MNKREMLSEMILRVGGRKIPIQETTSLYHDLSIAGDDAGELFDNIQKTFGTTFDGLHFDEYFPNECDDFFFHLAKLFGYRDKRKALTFGHLLDVVERGYWFDPQSQ